MHCLHQTLCAPAHTSAARQKKSPAGEGGALVRLDASIITSNLSRLVAHYCITSLQAQLLVLPMQQLEPLQVLVQKLLRMQKQMR